MKKEYDFSKARKNPCANKLKKQIITNIDIDTIDYRFIIPSICSIYTIVKE